MSAVHRVKQVLPAAASRLILTIRKSALAQGLLDCVVEEEKMNCYFYGAARERESILGHNGVVAFSIPDLNLIFKAQIKGTQAEAEYASLIALLEFIELNPKLFKNGKIQIYGDSPTVVHQINFNLGCSKELEPYRNLALQYRRRISYTLGWVSREQNRAYGLSRASAAF